MATIAHFRDAYFANYCKGNSIMKSIKSVVVGLFVVLAGALPLSAAAMVHPVSLDTACNSGQLGSGGSLNAFVVNIAGFLGYNYAGAVVPVLFNNGYYVVFNMTSSSSASAATSCVSTSGGAPWNGTPSGSDSEYYGGTYVDIIIWPPFDEDECGSGVFSPDDCLVSGGGDDH